MDDGETVVLVDPQSYVIRFSRQLQEESTGIGFDSSSETIAVRADGSVEQRMKIGTESSLLSEAGEVGPAGGLEATSHLLHVLAVFVELLLLCLDPFLDHRER